MKGSVERVSFEVTGKCNLHCFYCCRGYLNSPEKISKELSTDEIVKTIRDARNKKCRSFLFTGGEAFIKNDFDKILKECGGCFVEVYSNGTLLFKKHNLNLIKKYVSRLTVTIDGLNSHNYYRKGSDYKKILKNIKLVQETSPDTKIKINTLVNKKSVNDLPKLYGVLKRLEVDEWHIDFPQLRGRLAEYKGKFSADYGKIGISLKKVLRQYYKDNEPFYLKIYKIFSSKLNKNNIFEPDLKENPCSYKTDYSMFINAEGKYILCPSIPYQDITVANIKTDSFITALQKKKSLKFQKISFKDLKDCLNCRYMFLCLGGCRGEAKVLSDSFTKPDLNSCSLMRTSEKIIYPSLPKEIANIYLDKIDKNKTFPQLLKNLDDLKNNLQKKYTHS